MKFIRSIHYLLDYGLGKGINCTHRFPFDNKKNVEVKINPDNYFYKPGDGLKVENEFSMERKGFKFDLNLGLSEFLTSAGGKVSGKGDLKLGSYNKTSFHREYYCTDVYYTIQTDT